LLTSQGVDKEDLVRVYRQMAVKNIQPRIEEFAFDDINEALDQLRRGEVNGRLYTRPGLTAPK